MSQRVTDEAATAGGKFTAKTRQLRSTKIKLQETDGEERDLMSSSRDL